MKYVIEGGKSLSGIVDISGSKNAALPVLCATVINGGKNVIRNCPNISDVRDMCRLLRDIGCSVKKEGSTITVNSSEADGKKLNGETIKKIRSSITLMGAVAGRFGSFSAAKPGGCVIGKRPVDIHINALKSLGAEVEEKYDEIKISAQKLKGGIINMPFPSVGATENAMMAAVFAEGKTVIVNSAREPEIICLQNFLKSIGVKIFGAERGYIVVEGCKKFNNSDFEIIYDRIEAGTFLCSAAMCRGDVFLKNAPWREMTAVLEALSQTGCEIYACQKGIWILAEKRLKNIYALSTGVYPLFPTDMQPLFTAMLTRAKGKSIIVETVFEKRMGYVDELKKFGADISCSDRVCVVNGVKCLKGTSVYAKDLRAGACLINAALSAEGESTVYGSEFVRRGYENIEKKLALLGAKIRLEKDVVI